MMQRAWRIAELTIDFQNKTARVALNDGATHVSATFPFDAAGDAPESAVRAAALRKALEVFGDAEKARLS